jgi:hypothetical protein
MILVGKQIGKDRLFSSYRKSNQINSYCTLPYFRLGQSFMRNSSTRQIRNVTEFPKPSHACSLCAVAALIFFSKSDPKSAKLLSFQLILFSGFFNMMVRV